MIEDESANVGLDHATATTTTLSNDTSSIYHHDYLRHMVQYLVVDIGAE